MKDTPNNIPPADQPSWGGPFNWEQFKFHHFGTLKKYHKLLEKQFKKIPLGIGYKQKDVKILLSYLDELISLYDWLPNTGGGRDTMKKIIKSREEFEKAYLNKDQDDMSYWRAQEISSDVFIIYNYMSAMCEI